MGWKGGGTVSTMDHMEFHRKLMQHSAARRISQQLIAEILGKSKNTVGNWFAGKGEPSMREALELSRMLDVDIAYLADDSIEEPMSLEELAILEVLKREGFEDLFRIPDDRKGEIDAEQRLVELASAANHELARIAKRKLKAAMETAQHPAPIGSQGQPVYPPPPPSGTRKKRSG